jgi:hypothetical protein
MTDDNNKLELDDNAVCNFCHEHDRLCEEYPTGERGMTVLKEMADKIKADMEDRPYDVIVGFSGGQDSSYMLHMTVEILGLRALAVTFDNGWDTPSAAANRAKLCRKLGVKNEVISMDYFEFDDIARSFFEAGLPEIEAHADIGLATALYQAAEKHKVKYIFNGHNFRNEGITPPEWFYFDGRYVCDVHDEHGNYPRATLPNMGFWKFLKWTLLGYKRIRPLYYMDVPRVRVRQFLENTYGWEYYGGHHHENIHTVFSNRVWLPKFGIDLRMHTNSALIRSNQMTRAEALAELTRPPQYPGEYLEIVRERYLYAREDWLMLLHRKFRGIPARRHKTYKRYFKILKPLFWVMYKLNRVPKSFYIKYCGGKA